MIINAVYDILDSPRIWLTIGAKQWDQLENPSGKPAYLLANAMWHFSWKSVLKYHKQRIALKKRNIHLIILNNSEAENRFCRRMGFQCEVINHNTHCCEHLFFPLKNEPQKYDAVYVAAAKPYKRIHLAEKIEKLFVVTYFWPDVRDEEGKWNLHRFEPRVSHCEYNRDRIPKEEVNRILNQGGCALALSAKEGAMFASMEYMLAGRPVVSTTSLGGRDFFFDDRYVEIVKDSPEGVKAGVDKLIAKKLDPAFIREETMKKVNASRKKFYDLVVRLATKHGGKPEPYEAFYERLWGKPDGLARTRIM